MPRRAAHRRWPTALDSRRNRGGFLSGAVAAGLGGTAYFYSVASLLVCGLAAQPCLPDSDSFERAFT
jgi:hypothetical protein